MEKIKNFLKKLLEQIKENSFIGDILKSKSLPLKILCLASPFILTIGIVAGVVIFTINTNSIETVPDPDEEIVQEDTDIEEEDDDNDIIIYEDDTLEESLEEDTDSSDGEDASTPTTTTPDTTTPDSSSSSTDSGSTGSTDTGSGSTGTSKSYSYTLPSVSTPSSTGSISVSYFEQVILYMMVNDISTFECTFTNTSGSAIEAAGIYDITYEAFVRMQDMYHEIGCYYNNVVYSWSSYGSTVTYKIVIGNSSLSYSTIYSYKASFISAINQLVTEMYASGAISESDSDYTTALYFYKWCAYNIKYDSSYTAAGYTGYGALFNGTSVCQGYTAVFNALCNAAGIDCVGISGTVDDGNHIWNYAKLDGTWYYIDVTFGDPVPDTPNYCDTSYFGLTKAQISTTHVFKSYYQ